ncbi:hypothetical protein BDZ97DRAFT_1912401 [Flammula alnicola]|nr:hypothetical protein BDZ97DRAFT_1912401 [Flammula alnicola]
MPLFKKKPTTLIPPVSAPISTSSSSTFVSPSRGSSNTYIASRDGDPYNGISRQGSYNKAEANDPYVDKYNRNRGVGDVYSRGTAELDSDRNELFSGYNPSKGGSGRFFDGPDVGRAPPPGEENDEDVEGIKQQTRFVKQESVNSTRNALRMAREAEETARNTLTRLGDQSEKLANTERHLDVSKGHSQRADDKTDELKQLNRSIFRPVITFNKDSKRAAQEAKLQARYEDERDEREKAMMDIRDTQNRLGRAATYGRGDDDEELLGGRSRMKTVEQLSARKEQRKRYQFEANASDDEVEDELDDNLDEISEATKRLKALGMTMGDELDKQVDRIKRIEDKTVDVDGRLYRNTEREIIKGSPVPVAYSSGVKTSENTGPLGREDGPRKYDPKTYGVIPGIEVGTWWETRQGCSADSIHAPWVGGISGGSQGAYSVALSGGYDDDVDLGYAFTYTGSGGRDLKGTKTAPKNLRTAPQSSDQTFDNTFNKMLQRSCETKKPVRVIRGFKVRSPYAPSEGYRYDGLYRVEKAWSEKGRDGKGYLVCKFAFKRLPGQPPLPVRDDKQATENADDEEIEEGEPNEEEPNEEELKVELRDEELKDVELEDVEPKDVELEDVEPKDVELKDTEVKDEEVKDEEPKDEAVKEEQQDVNMA